MTTTVLKRLVADWLILVAAITTITLSAVLLALGPIYADAVSSSALQQTLTEAPTPQASLQIAQRLPASAVRAVDVVVRDEVDETFGDVATETWLHTTSESFALSDPGDGAVTDLIAFQWFEAIEGHATLIAGRWPVAGSDRVEVAITAAAAEAAGIDVGSRLTAVSRRNPDQAIDIAVVGMFAPIAMQDTFWFGEELVAAGATESGSFRTIGPVVVASADVLADVVPNRIEATWRVGPSFGDLEVDGLPGLQAATSNLETSLNQEYANANVNARGASTISVATELDDLLAGSSRSLTITRSSVIALLFQLAILAGYTLVLTAGLLVESRSTETELLRSRGASPTQLLVASAVEALIVTVPAAVAAPPIAAWLVRRFDTAGPLGSIGLTLGANTSSDAYTLAVLAAAGALVALVVPAYRSARATYASSPQRRRSHEKGGAQRLGIDIALLVLAAAVIWQLGELGPRVAARVQGMFGVDPLLVAAPAVGLLAGSVLALRMVPLMARLSERLARLGRSTVPALSAWQVARRPARYSRSSLLLVMAVGIGFFTAAFSTTWVQSQGDQADFRSGADLTVTPDVRAATPLQLGPSIEQIDDVAASMPLLRERTQLERLGQNGFLVLLDAAKAAETVRVRSSLAPEFASQMERLVAGRPQPPRIELPGEPTAVGMEITAAHIPFTDDQPPAPVFDGGATLVVQDGDGLLHRIDLGKVPVDEGSATLHAEVASVTAEGAVLEPVYPLSVISIELTAFVPEEAGQDVSIVISNLLHRPRNGADFEPVPAVLPEAQWRIGSSLLSRFGDRPELFLNRGPEAGSIHLTLNTGIFVSQPTVTHSLRLGAGPANDPIPAVTTTGFLTMAGAEVGDEMRLGSLRIDQDSVEIVGAVEAFPTIAPDTGEVFVLDLPTVQLAGLEPGRRLRQPTQYWLAIDGDPELVTEMLVAGPISAAHVESRNRLSQSLTSDPVALGTIGALAIGFAAAAIFAAVGFSVSATVSARERLTEFALLRALGLSPRQLGTWLSAEQGVLVVVSLVFGTIVGAILTAAVIPLISLTQAGDAAFPPVEIVYPWAAIARLDAVVLATLGIVVAALTIALRRIGLGSALRMGEDR